AASTGKSVPATSHNRARTDVPPTSTRAGLPRRLGNIAARRPAAASARTAVPTTSRKSAPASTRTAVPPKSTRTTTPWKHGQAPTPADSFDWSALLLLLLVAFTVFVIAILAFMRPSAPAVSPQENAASTQTTVSSSYLSLQTYKDPNYLTLGTSFDNPHLPGRLMLTDDTEVQHHG
ncbi:MAG: hypothetical protein Q4P06_09205, partial [Actinomycetaceae bacterium]|nr:hypothetical protein [Actinomycetaceae bacterium]